ISFALSSDKSQLTVINRTGLVANQYQYLLQADFLTKRPDIAADSCCGVNFFKGADCKTVTASVRMCNPGAGPNPGGMPVSFYDGDPTTNPNAKRLHTGASAFNLPVGQ